MDPIIIIGTGLAGYQLAREFRRGDTTTPLMLISADEGNFYSKPLLSTALTNKKTLATLTTATPQAMEKQLNATIHINTTVDSIDPTTKTLTADGKKIPYEKLVLACGADVIKAKLEGDGAADVLSVNHLYHYAVFQELIKDKKKITILGAGLIGCEFANDLSNAGYEVHVVAPAIAPLDLLVPHVIGKLLQDTLANYNIHWHLECVVNSVAKTANGYHLTLSNGEILDTELVLSAIGLIPHIKLAATAGIQTGRGIIVNRYLETSVADIYAMGDCAEVEGHVLPYITPLLQCARALAKTLTGVNTAVDYPAMPVIVKTPAHPLAICPPPKGIAGNWKMETVDHNVRALFYDAENRLRGFVLTNDAVKERMELAKQLPPLF